MSCSKLNIIKSITTLISLCFISASFAAEVPIYDFSINSYTQNANDYLPSDSEDYAIPLLKAEYQKEQMQRFYNHYYSSDAKGLSPWSGRMVNAILPLVKGIELEILEDFDNQNIEPANYHYAENFKMHDTKWLNRIKQNMDLDSIDSNDYKKENRAIAVTNTHARALPEIAPDFYHFTLAGQGFPFDNLQESAIWAGTPLYVVATSKDKAWSLVLTPDMYFAWVRSNDIAYASPEFINQWQTTSKEGLVAITETETSIVDTKHEFQFTGYIGAVFPLADSNDNTLSILIPVKNQHHQAAIAKGIINKKSASIMPLLSSKKNIVKLLKQLQNRPYGWGGAFFYNDCSQELKSLFTPLGIWLPRNSGKQAQLNASLDLAKNTMDERISILKEKGHPLMTLIYIGGHVMLYVGTKKMEDNTHEAITYQNLWGLSPASRDKRYVIGQSLFFPLLKSYPENPDVVSLANKSLFKLVYLDELDDTMDSPQSIAKQLSQDTSSMDL